MNVSPEDGQIFEEEGGGTPAPEGGEKPAAEGGEKPPAAGGEKPPAEGGEKPAAAGGEKHPEVVDYKAKYEMAEKRLRDLQGFTDKKVSELMTKLQEREARERERPPEKPRTAKEQEEDAALQREVEKILKDQAVRKAVVRIFEEQFGGELKDLRNAVGAGTQRFREQVATRMNETNATAIEKIKEVHKDADEIRMSPEFLEWYQREPAWVQAAGRGAGVDREGNLVPGGGVEGGILVLNRYKEYLAKTGGAPGGGSGAAAKTEEDKKRELDEAGGLRPGAALSRSGKGSERGEREAIFEMDDDEFERERNKARFG